MMAPSLRMARGIRGVFGNPDERLLQLAGVSLDEMLNEQRGSAL
jgi:hypothetical protein